MKMLRCVIMRGGTSKGVYFHENELPKDPELRDKIILDVFGSPDVREIDGLGGADVLTSKVCIIGPSNRDDADVDYTFDQVIVDKSMVDHSINCGNLSSGVGPFAIDEGLVKPVVPMTKVRIYNTNTKKILIANVFRSRWRHSCARTAQLKRGKQHLSRSGFVDFRKLVLNPDHPPKMPPFNQGPILRRDNQNCKLVFEHLL